MRSSKTRIWWVIAALVLLLAAAAVWFFCLYSVSDGRLIARKADVIDLRGEDISVQEAEALAAKYPDKTVLWDVPLSGGSRPSSAESLSLSSLSADDIPLFACFPNLKSIDASGCADYEALLALRSAYPALDLTAFVTVGGKAVPMDAQRAVLRADTPLAELLETLPFLPELYRVSFTGGAVSYEMQDALTAAFPALSFRWDVEVLGVTASSAAKELSFAGQTLTAQDVNTLCDNLFRFPALERIDLTGCGLTAEQIKAVRSASGAVTVYELELFGKTVSTDALELDFSGIRMGLSGAAIIEKRSASSRCLKRSCCATAAYPTRIWPRSTTGMRMSGSSGAYTFPNSPCARTIRTSSPRACATSFPSTATNWKCSNTVPTCRRLISAIKTSRAWTFSATSRISSISSSSKMT